MSEKQVELLDKVRVLNEELSKLNTEYWKEFSSFNDLKFWIVVLILVIPLIVLLWKIDRDKMLLLGFYGMNYHIWFAYTNSAAIRMGFIDYPYEILPILPSFALDASLVPACYMLVYQWTLNRNKNFYLYSILLSAVFAFIMKPILIMHDLFRMFKGWNYFTLFLFYVGLFIFSKVITNIFLKMQEQHGGK
ncbi:hypothetical protein EKG37_19035 [Robertmurraya yapensis]|uniref:Uncharacterized protein n=1 Tax=Bacillus yapensis TaxID=2492960 RepID=A0A431VWK3_9BACI|nr:CBO0543 family protein [Bacillus yapensis]RTR27613.1 hypothetical protein EKG37_19035 [Bacillus yapensis]TKS94180.1 hypothetical protein FAR12_19045 [Bacillus yapensis]